MRYMLVCMNCGNNYWPCICSLSLFDSLFNLFFFSDIVKAIYLWTWRPVDEVSWYHDGGLIVQSPRSVLFVYWCIDVDALTMSTFYCINFLIMLSVNPNSVIVIIIFMLCWTYCGTARLFLISRDVMRYIRDYFRLICTFGLFPKLREIMSNFR